MKIESTSNTSLASLQNGTQRASQSDAKEAVGNVQQAGSTKNSTVNLSAARAANGSDIDTAKVESIKAAIRDGSLTIDTSKIADGILSPARDLLKSKTPPTGG